MHVLNSSYRVRLFWQFSAFAGPIADCSTLQSRAQLGVWTGAPSNQPS